MTEIYFLFYVILATYVVICPNAMSYVNMDKKVDKFLDTKDNFSLENTAPDLVQLIQTQSHSGCDVKGFVKQVVD